ncbi:MAG: hypothetical protein OXN90_08035 [Gemmatimonadota bacterium]|nr:hypothetical protein [Gemmatimonadota bacterium]
MDGLSLARWRDGCGLAIFGTSEENRDYDNENDAQHGTPPSVADRWQHPDKKPGLATIQQEVRDWFHLFTAAWQEGATLSVPPQLLY